MVDRIWSTATRLVSAFFFALFELILVPNPLTSGDSLFPYWMVGLTSLTYPYFLTLLDLIFFGPILTGSKAPLFVWTSLLTVLIWRLLTDTLGTTWFLVLLIWFKRPTTLPLPGVMSSSYSSSSMLFFSYLTFCATSCLSWFIFSFSERTDWACFHMFLFLVSKGFPWPFWSLFSGPVYCCCFILSWL